MPFIRLLGIHVKNSALQTTFRNHLGGLHAGEMSSLLPVTKMCHSLDPSPQQVDKVVPWFLNVYQNETQVRSSGEMLGFVSEGGCITGTGMPQCVPHIVSPGRAATASDSSWRPPQNIQGACSMAGTQEPFVEWNASRTNPSASNKNVTAPLTASLGNVYCDSFAGDNPPL